MNIPPIKMPADHRAALEEINLLMMAEMGTPEGDRLDVLATLVEAYEATRLNQLWSTRIIDAGVGSSDRPPVFP